MHRAQAFLFSTAFLAALLLAGCGSSSPVAPTPAAPKGAAITGTVVTGLSLEAQRASRPVRAPGTLSAMCCGGTPGITVTVVGTNISTTTNEYGQFSMGDVPPGTVTLQFTGDGVNATLTVNNLVANQTFTLIVEVAGSTCHVWNENNTTVEELRFVGRVESYDSGVFVVSGVRVLVTSDTQYRPVAAAQTGQKCEPVCQVGSPSDLPIGTLVEVLGMIQTDGSIRARQITAMDLTCQ